MDVIQNNQNKFLIMDSKRKEVAGKFNINGKIYTLYGGVNPIGRNREATVNIKSLGVSQHHAQFILVDDDLHFICDLKSSNGTFLNNKKLDPLHLYRLDNGNHIKFGDMEGIYTKVTIDDLECHANSTYSENTQNFTQTFYGNNTQILDNTKLLKKNYHTSTQQSYIASQLLVEMADKLEESYIEAHEQVTQVISVDDHPCQSKIQMSGINYDESNFHEAVTQEIVPNEERDKNISNAVYDFNEAETQVLGDDFAPVSSNQTLNVHEMETQVLDNVVNVSRLPDNQTEEYLNENSIISTSKIENLIPSQDDDNPGGSSPTALYSSSLESPEPLKNSVAASKLSTASDDDIRPVKKSVNIFESQKSSFHDAIEQMENSDFNQSESSKIVNNVDDDDDDDIIRPVKKSVNIFESQDSSFNDAIEQMEKSDFNQSESFKIVNNVDDDDDIIKPVKKSVNIIESQGSSLHDTIEQMEESDLNQSACSKIMNNLDDDDDDDIIKPVKKSVNIFESQDSSLHDTIEQMEKSDLNQSACSKIINNIDNDDIIRPVKNSSNIFESQDSDETEENSNDSVDFMTMQKIQNTQRFTNSEEESPRNESNKTDEQYGTKNPSLESSINENLVGIDDGSETEDEIVSKICEKEGNMTRQSNASLNKPQNNNSEADIEENTLNSDIIINKRKKTLIMKKRKKNANNISESDEEENKNNTSSRAIICSDSDTEIEDNENLFEKIGHLEKKNHSISLVLEESVVEDLSKNTEKLTDNEVTVNQNTLSRISMGYNESLNDSDFIPSTQENNSNSISQSSKLENSENSFKLGLTQLMDEDNNTSHQNKLSNSQSSEKNKPTSQNQQKTIQEPPKKFTFKKPSLGTTEQADITLDYEEDIYQAKTQNVCSENVKLNDSIDDHVFIQPTQEAPKKLKQNKDESIPDEDIYLLSTQKFDGGSHKSATQDFYQESTQKLVIDEVEHKKTELRLSGNEFYLLPTQKIPEIENSDNVESHKTEVKTVDEDDIFATQTMDVNESPTKSLESQLEHMFATQRPVPLEDTLNEIEGIVLSKGIIDGKLPSEDKDLEAILATQKMIDSPKNSPKRTRKTLIKTPEKSIESQLEVIFASQTCNLPPDKFVRPSNPLVNVFGNDTQDHQISTSDESKSIEDENSIMKSKKTSLVGLEQSFALLEAKSSKIKRSRRNKDCEEITVSCPKSRVSMVPVPNEDKIMEEPILSKNTRTSRKRQPANILESAKTDQKEPRKSKRRRLSESSNASDEEYARNIPSGSNKSETKNKLLDKIQEDLEISERPNTPSKRSSRIKKNEQNIKSSSLLTNEDKKSLKTRTSKTSKTRDTLKEKEVVKDKLTITDKNSSETSENKAPNMRKEMETEERKSTRTKSSKIVTQESKRNIVAEDEYPESKSNVAMTSKTRSKKVIDDSDESFEIEGKNPRRPLNTNVRKLREDVEHPTTPSRTTKRGCKIQETTPSKLRKVAEATPSTSKRRTDLQDTPTRSKRKLKPKVVFTMMENPRLESQIKQLGGSVVESVDSCTVLITKFVKRSMKLLSAVGLGKPICSEEWVLHSKTENDFLDPWDYILIDKEAEKKWNFSLKTSLERSLQAKLFEGYTFQLLVTNALDVLKGAIESCGGKIVSRVPKGANNFVVVASPDQKEKYKKLLKQHSNLTIVEPEAIFDGVLRQKIQFERHLLK